MWTIKSKEVTAVPNSTQMQLAVVYTQGKDEVALTTIVSTEQEVRQAINVNLARLNDREAVIKAVADGTFKLEEEVKEAPVLSAEELAKQEIEAKRQELEVAKKDVELGLLTEADYTAKVTAMKAVKEVKEVIAKK